MSIPWAGGLRHLQRHLGEILARPGRRRRASHPVQQLPVLLFGVHDLHQRCNQLRGGRRLGKCCQRRFRRGLLLRRRLHDSAGSSRDEDSGHLVAVAESHGPLNGGGRFFLEGGVI